MTIYSLSIYHWMFYKGVFRNVPHSCAVVTLFGGEWLLWILMVFHCESMVSWPYNNYEWPYFWNETSSKSAVTTICQAVASKRSSIEDLVLMRTKLLKWTSIGPHFTQKASFSPCSSYMIYLRTWKCYSAIRCGIIHMNLVKHASPGKWDNMTVKKN